ncbi:tyrosine-type recombinase/integrase [Solidesulfovibrio carbinolicus]|uniref:Site-specific integrase n=1 Tax=Solidesulfovibrio carbinolicus TaxID=296842 RepID=A0A4P6HQG6_9BACT|nr:site-specific integrase [Solidesulfovibrio carbinolicus]QAZ67468.1 site-specific integrase [Solidesulfovibrio carbinolicus]
MASIKQRGPLQWQATIRKRGYPTTCKTFDTKAEADAWAKEIETEMNKSQFVSRKEAERYTLAECLDRFKNTHVQTLKNPQTEIYRIEGLKKRALSRRIMATIQSHDIAAFCEERLEEGVSANTIRLDLAILSKLFNLAKSKWNMRSLENPVQYFEKPKLPSGRDRRFEDDEEERLFEAIGDDFEFRACVTFALETAMRRGEIVKLKWKDVFLERQIARLADTKNGKPRTVPLQIPAVNALNSLPRHISGKIFPSYNAGQTLSKKMQKACKKAGIPNFRFHDLRHEAISRLFEETDLDVMEIKEITGHETLQMLARYAHLRTERLVKRLNGAKRGEAQAGA